VNKRRHSVGHIKEKNDGIHIAGRVYRQNAINLHTADRQMATLDVAKLLLLTNQTKLTLTVAEAR